MITNIVRLVEFGYFGKQQLNVHFLQVHEQYIHYKVQNVSIDLLAISLLCMRKVRLIKEKISGLLFKPFKGMYMKLSYYVLILIMS